MAAKMIVAVLLACVCMAYASHIAAPIATYGAAIAAPAVAAYPHAPIAAPIATYSHTPIAAPIATYAHTPAVATYAVPAPVAVYDATHFSYGYNNPHLNGRVDVARNGPIASHAYNFRAGTLF